MKFLHTPFRCILFLAFMYQLLSAVSCSDYSVRKSLMLADSLCMTDVDSSTAILNSLIHKTQDMKESDRLYFDAICQRTHTIAYCNTSSAGQEVKELLTEQENVLKASARRSEKILTIALIVILFTLFVFCGLTMYFAFLHKREIHKRERYVSFYKKKAMCLTQMKDNIYSHIQKTYSYGNNVNNSPEVDLMRKRCMTATIPSINEWNNFQSMIDENYNSLSKHLLSSYRLSEQELRVCLLIKAGFKPIEISKLTARSKEAICSTRRRLYKKITGENGTPKMLDSLLKKL